VVVLNSSRQGPRYLVPVFAWAFLIFLFSSIPGKDIPRLFTNEDIFFHFAVYAVLGWLIIRALKNYCPGLSWPQRICLAAMLGLLYAVSDEFHQLFVPNRHASVLDILVDGLGGLTGSILFMNRVLDKMSGLTLRPRKE